MKNPKKTDAPITDHLRKWHGGSQEDLQKVIELTYTEIRNLAAAHFHRAQPGDTLCPTALLNEAFVMFQKQPKMVFESRKQFFWFFSRLMRNAIVDQIRIKLSRKRDAWSTGPMEALQFKIFGFREEIPPQTLLDLDRALKELAENDPRQCRIVEGFFFAGLTMIEMAALERVSPATIKRDLRFAKKWLARQL